MPKPDRNGRVEGWEAVSADASQPHRGAGGHDADAVNLGEVPVWHMDMQTA